MLLKTSREQKVIGGVLSLAISGLIVKFLGLIYKIPLSYVLSDEGMSYFNSAYTVYTFFYIICTAGVPKAISIIVSEGENKCGFAEHVYKSANVIFLGIGLIITLTFMLLSNPISVFVGNRSAAPSMIMIAPSVLFTCLSGVIRGYFNGTLNFLPIAISEVISGSSKLVFGLLLGMAAVHHNCDLYIVSAMTILGTTIGSFLGYVYLLICKKTNKTSKKTEQNSNITYKSVSSKLFKIAVPITLTSAITSIGGVVDLAITMQRLKYAGYTELQTGILYGNYTTLAIPMLNLIASLIAPVSAVLLPIVAKNEIKNDNDMLSERLSTSLGIVCYISIPVVFLFLFKSENILSILFEDSASTMAAPLLSILAPGIFFLCMLMVINTSLEGIGKTNIPLISLFVGAVVKFIISYVLIGNDSFGIMGAPIGTTASYFISLLISVCYVINVCKVRVKIYFPLLTSFVYSLISIICSVQIGRLFKHKNLLITFVEIGIFFLVYGFFVLLMFFNIKKREKTGKNAQNCKQ